MDLQDLETSWDNEPKVGSSAFQEGDDCPEYRCPGKLIKRFNKQDESEFLGCSNFPECKFTH